MSYWLVVGVAGVLLASGTFVYTAWRWRCAPDVHRAMNWLVAASITAGCLLALPFVHWVGVVFPPPSRTGAGSGFGEALKGQPMNGVSRCNVALAAVWDAAMDASSPRITP